MTPLTPEEIEICQALNLIRFYPKELHHIVLEDIAAFAGPEQRAERLRWLVATARQAMAAEGWRDDLKGLWCTRFPAADGTNPDCTIPGFTPEDNEAHRQEIQAAETDCKLAQWKREAAQLPAGERQANQGLLDAANVRAALRRLQ